MDFKYKYQKKRKIFFNYKKGTELPRWLTEKNTENSHGYRETLPQKTKHKPNKPRNGGEERKHFKYKMQISSKWKDRAPR